MKIYWFMLAWVIIFGIMSQMKAEYVHVGEERYEARTNLFMALVTFSVIIFFAGMRSHVADTTAYIKMFNEYPLFSEARDVLLDSSAREPGFRLFSILIKTYISDNYGVWLWIIAIISGICVMVPLYKYSCNFGVSAFLFMASCQFIWMFNGMRQFMVASVIFACTGLILRNKTILYIVVVCILSTIHTSALILIPMYFIAKGEPWNQRTMIFIVVIVLAMVFADKFTNLLTDVVETTDYATSVNEFKNTDDGTSLIRILVESVPIIIAFIYRDKIKDKLTPVIKLSINMSLIASGLYIISKIAKSGILLGRLPIYFSMYNLILLPWLLQNIFEEREKNLIYYTMIVCYFGFFYYQMCIAWGGMDYNSIILNLNY
ncbi:EpsG family protein [Terrisporobacter mayombei]|uniref:Transmembrane protein EpsG n=1 Tax=Terrisporobacter mayombei TaxID=1541 RepID=A0ABY9Q677_9FIRM|nr:EpsG family protein [Terrisporobacter mayombei]MCC3869660.1 EpsG family protein [Terrisporobacter mayombei]WMT83402.1 Transmembrane protein EpsG [Terrisporobacter mayombei]